MVSTPSSRPVAYICRTCGVQYAPSLESPASCIICTDPRQYVGWGGQRWTSLEELRREGYTTEVRSLETDLFGIGTEPAMGIGQRGLLVRSAAGNVLWDVPGYVDQDAIDQVHQLGGLGAISASHPHFYGTIVEWAEAFDAPIFLPEADAAWVTRPDPKIRTYQNIVELVPGITLIRCGGHFDGSAVLHWAAGAEGRGALLTGDTITVVQDRDYVSFMWSYPNLVPLDRAGVRQVVERVEPYPFDRIYGGWWDRVVAADARAAVQRSTERYLRFIG